MIHNLSVQWIDSDECSFGEGKLEASLQIDPRTQREHQIHKHNHPNTDVLAYCSPNGRSRLENGKRVRRIGGSIDVEVEVASNVLKIDFDIKSECVDDGVEGILEEGLDVFDNGVVFVNAGGGNSYDATSYSLAVSFAKSRRSKSLPWYDLGTVSDQRFGRKKRWSIHTEWCSQRM